jgi:2-haloalkanoic acid dehalogenase type II
MANKIRCITFDCYGTLIDWRRGIEGALLAQPALAFNRPLVTDLIAVREEIEHGLIVSGAELPDEDGPEERFETPDYRPYREILAESLFLAAERLGAPLTDDAAEKAAATMPRWKPFADTRAALEEIRKLAPIAILSNVEEEVIRESIAAIGVPFDLVITAERVESYKPAPDHWYAIMHELEADEEEIFHLAASPFHDLETASLLGIRSGFINRGKVPLLPEATPSFEVPDLASAVPFMRRLAYRKSETAAATNDAASKHRGGGVRKKRGRGSAPRPRR